MSLPKYQKKKPLAAFVVSLFLCFPSFGGNLTLSEYLSQVKQSNPTLQSSSLRAQALGHLIGPEGTLDDPFIAGGIDQINLAGEKGYEEQYQLTQAFPFPGKLSAKSSAAENRANSAKSDRETLGREITVLATQAFFRAFYNQRALELNGKLRKIVEGTVESAKAQYKTGDPASHHDWLLSKIEISLIDIEKLRFLREQKTLYAVLNELRNQPAMSTIGKLNVQFSGIDLKENELPSLKDQPELKSLEFFISQAESERKLAKLSYFPDFVIQGSVFLPNSDMEDRTSSWQIMIGINIPLYFWNKQSELSTAATIDKEAAILEKRKIENRLNTESVDAKEQLKTAWDVLALYKNTVIPTTNLAVDNAKSGYAKRRLPLAQYLETLKTQRTQELEYLAAQIDVELARTRIRELLSSPPLIRFAPIKPSLFGGGVMGRSNMISDTINLGRGISPKSNESSRPGQRGGLQMGDM